MKKLLYFLIIFLISSIVLFLPITDLSRGEITTIFIFVLASLLWISEVIPLYITSFVILILEAFLLPHFMKGISAREFFYPFFSPVIVLFLGGFTISKGLHKFNIDKAITLKVISYVKGRPKLLIFSFMAITAFLSMWMSNTAATALMVGVILPVLERVKDKNYNIALLLAIAFGANIGGMGTPVGTPPNAIAIGILSEKGISIPFLEWMKNALPVSILLFLLTFLFLILLFPFSIEKIPLGESIESEIKKIEKKFSSHKMAVVVISIITVVLWLLSEWIKVSSSIVAILPIIAFFGFGILNLDDFSSLGWDILILMGGGLSLSHALEVTGVSEWIVKTMGLHNVSEIYVLMGFMAITILLTNFISNTTTAALILPLAVSVFKNPIVAGYVVAISASISMLLPVSTPPNAIVYSTRKIPLWSMIKAGIVVIIVSSIIVFFAIHTFLKIT